MPEIEESVFVGRYDQTLSPSGAFTVPEDWRFGVSGSRAFYILPDGSERCLDLVRGDSMERELAAVGMSALPEAACRIVADEEWRIEIPRHLREMAGISDEVSLVGCFRMVKIWSRRALDSDSAKVPDEFRKLLDGIEETEKGNV